MAELLTDEAIAERLEGRDWRRDGASITRDFEFADFVQAIDFVGRVADVAERQGHHPDIFVHGYKHVTLTLSSHSAGGITDSDFELAEKVDELV